MAEQHSYNSSPVPPPPEETTDHGCFDVIMRKKEPIAKPKERNEEHVVTDLNAGHEQKHTLMDELQRTNTHSTSSSEEEVEEGGERKRRKKKDLKCATTENVAVHGDKQGEDIMLHDTEKFNDKENAKTVHSHPDDENKGFLQNIKQKLHVPDQHKTSSEKEDTPTPPPPPPFEHSSGSNTKEKKGLIEKIKEKLPGGNHKSN